MATVATNILVDGLSGTFGKSLVFRTLRGKTYVNSRARKPDKKKESEAQRNTRVSFKKASEWARTILHDPEQKAYYQKRAKALKLPNAYTAAMTDYMRKPKVDKARYGDTVTYTIRKSGFTLKEVKIANGETGAPIPKATIQQNKDQWYIRYRPDDTMPSPLTLIITDNALREIQYVNLPI